MEELTKTQLILLALLVSFVTSIATGIVTISLLDQAPPGVTQTINRVVERTVEKVVPGQAASVITKETTVVIKEENLIIDAVEKNSKGVVRIGLPREAGPADEKRTISKVLGIGVLVSTNGAIATDSLNLSGAKEYLVETAKGEVYSAVVGNVDPVSGVAILQIIQSENEEEKITFSKSSFGKSSNLKLGQTVVAIGGLSENTLSTGIISKLNRRVIKVPSPEEDTEGAKDTVDGEGSEVLVKDTKILDSIETSAHLSSDYSGGPLINVDGFLLGVNIKRKDGDFSVPISIVLDIISRKSETVENQDKEQS